MLTLNCRSGVEEAQTERGTLLQEVHDLCREYNYTFKQPKKTLSKQDNARELGKDIRNKYALKLEQSHQPEQQSNMVELNEHDYYVLGNVPGNEVVVSNEDEDESQIDIPMTSLPPSPRPSSPKNGSEFVPTPSTSRTKANVNKVLGPVRKRTKREPIRQNSLNYLKNKAAEENAMKKKQLELEERRLALDETKLVLEESKVALELKKFEMECKERMEKLEFKKQRNLIDLEERKNINQLLKSQQIIIDNLLNNVFMVNNALN